MKINFKSFSHFFTLTIGSAFSLVINILALLVFSRIYSKEQFGDYAILISVVSILSILGTFRLEHLIVLQKTSIEAAYLSRVCIRIIKFFSLITLFLSLLFFVLSIPFFNQHPFMWLLLPVSIFSLSHIMIFLSWNNKIKNYKLISNYKILQSLIVTISGVLLGFFFNDFGLVFSYVFGLIVSFLFFNINYKKATRKFYFNSINNTDVKNVFKENKVYVKNSFGLEFFNTISKYIPNFILNAYYGSAIVGVYDMALKILHIPKNIISTNIGELYYQKASVFYHKSPKKFSNLSIKTFFILFAFSVVCYLPFILFGEDLFVFALGVKWTMSGKLSEIIAFWILLLFITSPVSYIFYIKKKLSRLFLFIFISFLWKTLILYYLAMNYPQVKAIFNYTYICVCLELILIFLILKQMKLHKKLT
ncbi:hypothetical protein CW731_14675 [Polaribacter sp. ALD11]|uniref:lipopolysaccharide biosynthesis protein n=1 Tax=Polaribacter sp. ALD11 TaxID=2058137 RepID=UPI000C311489|nr:oligosaccharide flippase family protein [Polaribacter sp. ALD11]AUC86447.1 hypothetical protein CW731_14675 [Polaribacter sp. ALD11]